MYFMHDDVQPEWLQVYSKNIMVKHLINKTP